MARKKIFTEEQELFIKNNYHTMTNVEIGNILGFKKHQIDGKIKSLGLKGKKRKINSSYFKQIDTPLKAYFIGYIFADGYITYNSNNANYELGIELQSEDSYILQKLNEELGGANIIKHNNPKDIIKQDEVIHKSHSDVLRVYSKELVEDLIAIGISTNKSHKDIIPIVPDEFFFDFLRGYIDGDGCFYNCRNNTYMHITCASIIVLQYIKDKLMNQYDIETRIYTLRENKHRLMCVNKNNMVKLVSRLYNKDGIFCLYRKYEKVKHLLGQAA